MSSQQPKKKQEKEKNLVESKITQSDADSKTNIPSPKTTTVTTNTTSSSPEQGPQQKTKTDPNPSSPLANVSSNLRKRYKILKNLPNFSVSFSDKIAFTVGVLLLVSTTYIFGHSPKYLPIWYILWMVPLMVYRFIDFHSQHAHYFMIDFCYMGNLALMFFLFFFPTSPHLFVLTFANNCGPILLAIVFWRNSLVFHDFDKLTSAFIHTFPPLISFAIRWYPEQFPEYSVCIRENCEVTWFEVVVPYIFFFLFWQISYFIKTEHIDRNLLKERSHIITSFRWITEMDKKSKSYKLGQKFSATTRLFAFMAFQLFYHGCTVLPVIFMFRYIYFHAFCLVAIYIVMVHNGSSFYFEKFVKMVAEQQKQAEQQVTQQTKNQSTTKQTK